MREWCYLYFYACLLGLWCSCYVVFSPLILLSSDTFPLSYLPRIAQYVHSYPFFADLAYTLALYIYAFIIFELNWPMMPTESTYCFGTHNVVLHIFPNIDPSIIHQC